MIEGIVSEGVVSCGGFIPEQSLDKVVFVAVLQSRIRSLGMEIGDGLMGFVHEILNFIILSSDVALGSCCGKGIVHVWDSWRFIKFFPLEIFPFVFLFKPFSRLKIGSVLTQLGNLFSALRKPLTVLATYDLTFRVFPLQSKSF